MALLWFRQQGEDRYEVRSAGNSRRLYRNGVFHSQFNENRPFTGGVWDLLMLPAFFFTPGEIKRVLVLGVGGGAVIRQLQRYIMPEQIVGVDLDPLHLELAARFFSVEDVELECADAQAWLAEYQGEKFDLIIDDLFNEQQGEPMRAVAMCEAWGERLLQHLAPGGAIVANFVSSKELRQSALYQSPQLQAHFPSIFCFTLKGYQNAIGGFLQRSVTTRQLRQQLRETIGECPEYTVRTLTRVDVNG